MCLPYIKFITYTISYLLFILLVVISSLIAPNDEKHRDKFSVFYPEYAEIYHKYVENEHLTYKFPTNDFFIRNYKPSVLDVVICVWLFGMY